MDIRIRPCTTHDVASVLRLWKRARTQPSVTDTAAAIRLRLRRDRRLFLLAWHGRKLVGSVMGGWDGWRGSIARLAVDPAYRCEGIASRLIDEVEAHLRKLGARRIGCVVLGRNTVGRAFWQDCRYRLDRSAVRYMKDLY